MPARKRRIGLALGSGSARGWAHLGAIRALEAAGIRPDVVAGTSIGALVGAAYALGKLDALEAWARKLSARDVIGFLDVGRSGGGLIKGERLLAVLRAGATDLPIEELPMPFAAVATALLTGEEIWLRTGSTFEAVRASIALPGLFPPVVHEGTLLVDGGLVNPVPISLVRAMGADVIIAVDLSSEVLGNRLRASAGQTRSGLVTDWMRSHGINPPPHANGALPSPVDIFITSMQVMQVRIARSRIAGDPPNLLVAPRVSQLDLLDFHRAAEAIDEGRRAVERVAEQLEALTATA